MVFKQDTRRTADETMAQIGRLREQVDALMKERLTPAVAEMAGRAEHAVTTASETVRGQAEAISGQVRQRPLVSILIAAGVGWALGRMMR